MTPGDQILEHIAQVLEQLAADVRAHVGSSTTSLAVPSNTSNHTRVGTNELLTRDDLAILLGVKTRTISRYVAAGQLPRPTMIGRYPRWRRAVIDRWLERRPR